MKKLVLSTFLILQVILGFAQSKTGFTGKVVESKSQKPMQNAVVSIQNTAYMQITNSEGKFTFNELAKETYLVLVKSSGYKDQLLSVDVVEGKIIDLGVVVMEEDITQEQQLSLVTITDNDLGDDNSGSETTSGLLQASRDVIQQTAAFNWGQARFKLRGLNNEYSTTMINGLVMNKMYDGRPQWSNWGGLNDATRNQEFTMGSAPSDYTFGNILGTQEINTRASIYRVGARISASGTNTNYNGRIMGTYASGMNSKGWAFVISASRRWAQEGYFEGTDYGANSIFASVEKKINNKHSLNFTSIYAQNSRAKNSANTNEVNDLMGMKYNSYWGWQDGEKRNSRVKNITEPINILSHYWKISKKTRLNTNVGYQTGSLGNSRIDYQSANNPDPTYYQLLPSFVNNDGGTQADIDFARNKFLNNSQINWNAMYYANIVANNGKSVYALYEDRVQDNQLSANSILDTQLADNINLNAGINYKNLRSRNSQRMLDLLGGDYMLDIDPFYSGDLSQADLNNPNRQIRVGDDYGYKYDILAKSYDAFTQFKFSYKKVDFYLAQNYSKTEYQRKGLYRNGIYANNSYGKSDKVTFENFGFKGGLTYKITGRHFLDFNGAYMTRAPFSRNVFYNARLNNNITPDIQSETIASADASYIIRAPKFKGRLTGYISEIKNATEVAFFYGEGLFDDNGSTGSNEDSFVSEVTTNINKRQMGAELGLEYQLTSTIKVTGVAAYGRYTYSNNPNLYVSDDSRASTTNTNPIYSFGSTYLKNYRISGTPQQAYSLGLEYRDPHFWWIGANANYLADNYVDVSNIMRTDNFSLDSSGVSYPGLTQNTLAKSLEQERLKDIFLVNLTGGKSWKIKNTTFGFFASINNLLDLKYKTSGFEQSRKATYPELVADHANGTPSFGNKYFYGFGRNYFVNVYINF